MMSPVGTSVKCLFPKLTKRDQPESGNSRFHCPTTKNCALDASPRDRLQYAIVSDNPELLAFNRALDELERKLRGLRQDLARLRPSPDQPENLWTDDEGLGGFASTLGKSA